MQKSRALDDIRNRVSKVKMVVGETGLMSVPRGVVIHDAGASFPDEMQEDEWVDFGRALYKTSTKLQWIIIDWVKFGHAKYGEKYTEAVARTGYSYASLRNMLSVDSRLSLRNDNLDYSHHVAVASLPPIDQRRILDRAEKGDWPVSRVKDEVRRVKGDEFLEGHVEIQKINRSVAYIGRAKPEDYHHMNTGEREIVREKLMHLIVSAQRLLDDLPE